ncbi:MAG: threonylcarbamoyl-AMP synthase [Clostridia bacterium]|nr:threonylcarbamoyl-AMP synthase [Clostridia bacterium]
MTTERLILNGESYDKNIERAAQILKNGGIVAVPTETVYGLAASAYSDDAIKKVFIAKGRPQDNPLIVHISNLEMLREIAAEIPESAIKCAEKFWPGPFTMVLKRTDKVAKSVCGGLDTVAIRMPANKIVCDVIDKSGPLAAPSANLSGKPSPTKAEHVLDDLNGKIDAVLMSQDCDYGVESTVVALFSDTPRLLRPGAVTVEQLREVLPDIVIDKAVLSEPESGREVASPGMKYKHYAPKTETYLVEGEDRAFADFVNSKADSLAVCFDEETEKIKIRHISYGSRENEISLARDIFSVLRQVDKYGVSAVYVHAPSKTGVGLAVYNRLLRAASFRVIKV